MAGVMISQDTQFVAIFRVSEWSCGVGKSMIPIFFSTKISQTNLDITWIRFSNINYIRTTVEQNSVLFKRNLEFFKRNLHCRRLTSVCLATHKRISLVANFFSFLYKQIASTRSTHSKQVT